MRRTLILAAVVLLVAACSHDSSDSGKVSISEGMTRTEAEQILGEPTAETPLDDGTIKATYDYHGGTWVEYDPADRVAGYIIGGYTGSP